MDALKDVDRVIVISCGDPQYVDAVDESVHDSVPALDADDYLATRGSEWVVADGVDGGVGIGGVSLVVVVVVLGCGEGEAGLAEGREGDEGPGGWEPLAGLEKDVGAIGGLEREG